jgi:GNAT superfamily N-acetyltransferase
MKQITDPKEARLLVRSLGERSPVLADTELHVFHGATLYVLQNAAGRPLAIDVSYFGKRVGPLWEPYENWYIGYVPTPMRGKGHGTRLRAHVDGLAAKAGCKRVHSLAGTLLGLKLHVSMGYTIWGLTPELEVVCDSPLIRTPEYLKATGRKIPAWAGKKLAGGDPVQALKPLSERQLLKQLAGRMLRYERKETLEQITS